MNHWVDITFDCLPLRMVVRMDVPIDASPKYQAFCQRVKAALEKHSTFNTYYLYNAACTYHLTNREDLGLIRFRFEGTVITDEEDRHAVRCDLDVELAAETCNWLTEPVVAWFRDGVRHAVAVEFDRYIEAGDLEQTKRRLQTLQAASDNAGGFVGMYL
jgi:hypothetical protein